MISLDWKDRLKKDSEEFFFYNIQKQDYDIDLIYNAYPKRVDNKIPREVVTLVAKTMSSKLAKTPKEYNDFYTYLWNEKGENGKIAFVTIMSKVVKKDPVYFIKFCGDLLLKEKDIHYVNLLLDKVVFPLLKKDINAYLSVLIQWLKKADESAKIGITKLLIKVIKFEPDFSKTVFKKLENCWLGADEDMIKANVLFMKALFQIDKALYINIYESYKNNREPVFAEILANSIKEYHPVIEEAVNNWARSGNVRLKRAGLAGQKIIKKKKK